jgi:PTH1 family peptidyl-tRNA hydrolase
VVGLGNPGSQYARTRHNAGFMALDALASRWGVGPARTRFGARVAEGTVRAGAEEGAQAHRTGTKAGVALMWPQTFMNESGRSVGPARGHYRVALDRLVVVYDEIDLPFGQVRVRLGGGTGGHNGMKSLKGALGGSEFWRVRLGVGRPPSTDPEIVAAYVLAPFVESPTEVQALLDRGAAAAEGVLFDGAPPTGSG